MLKVLAAAAVLAALGGGGLALLGDRPPPPPAQPIPFDHRVHAGRLGIGCLACHVYAERGPVAGVPSMARCRGCHRFVKEDAEDAAVDAQLKQLAARLAEDGPIAWVRVHRVPDHVRFTHQPHVRGGVACRECHGAVETMAVVGQVAPLSMGWCLECHRRHQAARPGALARLTDCTTCHK
jgi:predicted CXXCH cytochrome family protein